MQIKENIKAPRHWPLCGEFTGHRWIPRTNGQTRKMFPFDDVIMIASESSIQLHVLMWKRHKHAMLHWTVSYGCQLLLFRNNQNEINSNVQIFDIIYSIICYEIYWNAINTFLWISVACWVQQKRVNRCEIDCPEIYFWWFSFAWHMAPWCFIDWLRPPSAYCGMMVATFLWLDVKYAYPCKHAHI